MARLVCELCAAWSTYSYHFAGVRTTSSGSRVGDKFLAKLLNYLHYFDITGRDSVWRWTRILSRSYHKQHSLCALLKVIQFNKEAQRRTSFLLQLVVAAAPKIYFQFLSWAANLKLLDSKSKMTSSIYSVVQSSPRRLRSALYFRT
jgi:hypothetical protein